MSPEELREDHTREAIALRLKRGRTHSYLSDFIYGGIDGAVTTFAVVAGVAGAGLSPSVVLILGAANLIADGFSMGAANFAGLRAEREQANHARKEEEHEIRVHPEGEREEIRQIFAGKGFAGETLDRIVDTITSDREQWVKVMLAEEHGITGPLKSPFRAGSATFGAFVVIGAIPLLSYVIEYFGVETGPAFAHSCWLTAVAFAFIGAVKARFVDQKWWMGALETVAIGGAAAVLAYTIGALLKGIAG